jgi:hypothetical protein
VAFVVEVVEERADGHSVEVVDRETRWGLLRLVGGEQHQEFDRVPVGRGGLRAGLQVVAPHVDTVDDARLRPWPGIRTQTFASFFEQSIPAHRGCTTSIQTHHLPTGLTKEVSRGERG